MSDKCPESSEACQSPPWRPREEPKLPSSPHWAKILFTVCLSDHFGSFSFYLLCGPSFSCSAQFFFSVLGHLLFPPSWPHLHSDIQSPSVPGGEGTLTRETTSDHCQQHSSKHNSENWKMRVWSDCWFW